MITTINKAYKYRLYPNKEQKKILVNCFGQARFVYNYFLQISKDFYEANKEQKKKGLTYFDICKRLVELKQNPNFVWLKECNSQSLQQSLKHLHTAYLRFFTKQADFPVFKKKHKKQSFSVPQHFEIDTKNQLLYIPKLTAMKIVLHRKFKGTIKSVTISKTPSGKYFASVLCEVEQDIPIKTTGGEIGVDLGLHSFVVISNSEKVDPPKFLRKSEEKLAQLQRDLSHKKKGGCNRNKARIKVARMYEKISNQRQDFLHKLSNRLVCENQAIFAEDLNVKGIMANHKLAKSVADAGWGEFVRQIKYKSDWSGVRFCQVGRFFPSSKRCFHCGWINDALTLKDREWTCPKCGAFLDRDINAAQNILQFGKIEFEKLNKSNKVGRDTAKLKRPGRLRAVRRVAELGIHRL